MTRTPVTSTHIKSIGWEKGTLEVEFSDGNVYHYHGVPASKHAALMAEDNREKGSVGGHLHRFIKPHHGFTKVKK